MCATAEREISFPPDSTEEEEEEEEEEKTPHLKPSETQGRLQPATHTQTHTKYQTQVCYHTHGHPV